MRISQIITIVACTIALVARPANAQTPVGGGALMEVRVREHTIISGPKREPSVLSATSKFEWRKGAETKIVVADQNPLLFTYGVSTSTAETDQHKIAVEFGKSLSAFTATFANKSGGGGGAFAIEELDATAFLHDLGLVQTYLDSLPTMINRAAGSPADVIAVQESVAKWNTRSLSDKITGNYGKLIKILGKCLSNKPLATNDTVVVNCGDPNQALFSSNFAKILRKKEGDSLAKATAEAAKKAALEQIAADKARADSIATAKKRGTATGPNKPSPTPAQPIEATVLPPKPSPNGQTPTPGKVDPTPPVKGGASNSSPITGAAPVKPPAIEEFGGPNSGDPTLQIDIADTPKDPMESVIDFFLVAQSLRANVEQQLTLLKTFSSDVAAINTPKAIADVSYGLDSQKVEITVASASQYDSYLDAKVKNARDAAVGKYIIIITPYMPARISLAPAAIVYFPGDRKYSAVASGSSFEIQRTRNDYGAFTVAAMLDIVPSRWAEPTFGGSLQLGVSPIKDRIGFYGGASLKVQQVFSFGAGFAWQQGDRLVQSLSVGQIIAKEDLLKTEKRFGPGFYLNITVK